MKDTFVEKVDDFVKQHDVLKNDSTIVVGVSGGPDSLALLYYLLEKKSGKTVGNCSCSCGSYV
ncbi:hypothetical protein ACT7DG_20805 [Bacillus cereus]